MNEELVMRNWPLAAVALALILFSYSHETFAKEKKSKSVDHTESPSVVLGIGGRVELPNELSGKLYFIGLDNELAKNWTLRLRLTYFSDSYTGQVYKGMDNNGIPDLMKESYKYKGGNFDIGIDRTLFCLFDRIGMKIGLLGSLKYLSYEGQFGEDKKTFSDINYGIGLPVNFHINLTEHITLNAELQYTFYNEALEGRVLTGISLSL